LNLHLDHLRDSFGLMVNMASESKESMNVLGDFSRSALQETKDQFNQTDLMASAVEEMSLTSNTISQICNRQRKLQKIFESKVHKAHKRMQTILQSIASLSSEVEGGHKAVQSVTTNTEQISSICRPLSPLPSKRICWR